MEPAFYSKPQRWGHDDLARKEFLFHDEAR